MSKNKDDKEYFECACHSPEHTLNFFLDEDPEFPAIYGSVFLSEVPFHRRVWAAVKYIFGYKCRYGHFDEFILKHEDCDRFISLFRKFKKAGDAALKKRSGRIL